MAHSAEMPRSSWAAESDLSHCCCPRLGLKQTGTVMHIRAASPSLPCDSSGFQFPQPKRPAPKNRASSSSLWIEKALEILMEKGAKISPLQQGAQNLKFGFPPASTTPTSSAGHPEVPGLPYSSISWLFGKPKLLQNDPRPVIFPAAHH